MPGQEVDEIVLVATARRKRTVASQAFTRINRTLNNLLDQYAPPKLSEPQFDKFLDAWNKLEMLHNRVVELMEEEEEEDNFLVDPETVMNASYQKYTTYLQTLQTRDSDEK